METGRHILSTVVTLARLIRVEADKRARAHGMTRAQWVILLNVSSKPGLLQKELAEILEVEPISVARLVDRLEARGMVERRGDPSDRRCWRLHLGSAAQPLMGEIEAQLDGLAAILCAGTDAATQSQIAGVLDHMRDQIAQELRNVPPPPPGGADEVACEPEAVPALAGNHS
jgi:MarR family transcriptional regulator for hemolysin